MNANHTPFRSRRVGYAAVLMVCGCSTTWGVDGSAEVASLDDASAATACEGFSAYLEGELPVAEQHARECTVRGLNEGIDEAACRSVRDACVASTPRDVFTGIDCSAATASASCTATVAELEACAVATMEAQQERNAEVSCAIAGDFEALMRVSEPLPTPPECTAIADRCPVTPGDVFGSIGSVLGGG